MQHQSFSKLLFVVVLFLFMVSCLVGPAEGASGKEDNSYAAWLQHAQTHDMRPSQKADTNRERREQQMKANFERLNPNGGVRSIAPYGKDEYNGLEQNLKNTWPNWYQYQQANKNQGGQNKP